MLVDIVQGIAAQAVLQYGVDGAQAILHVLVQNTVGHIPGLGPIINAVLGGLI